MIIAALLPLALLLVLFAEAMADRHLLRQRVMAAVAVRSRHRAAPQRSTAAPILRGNARALDTLLQRWLPGGARLAADLAIGGRPLSLALVGGVATALAGGAAIVATRLGLPPFAALLLVPVLALAMAHGFAAARASRARSRFAAAFPDALAAIIRSLRASLPVTAAIGEVAHGSGPVARVFRAIVDDMGLGQPLETALWTAARRIGVAEFDFFAVTLTLQRETGGNLAVTLEGLAETLRMRRQLAMKIKAMSAEARASALIIGSLPFAMGALLWVSSPDYIAVLFTTPLGHALLGAGLASMAVGATVIGQMMQIKP